MNLVQALMCTSDVAQGHFYEKYKFHNVKIFQIYSMHAR